MTAHLKINLGPVLEGHSLTCMAGALVPVDPANYSVRGGKLYLFSRGPPDPKLEFDADPDAVLAKANANWVNLCGDLRM